MFGGYSSQRYAEHGSSSVSLHDLSNSRGASISLTTENSQAASAINRIDPTGPINSQEQHQPSFSLSLSHGKGYEGKGVRMDEDEHEHDGDADVVDGDDEKEEDELPGVGKSDTKRSYIQQKVNSRISRPVEENNIKRASFVQEEVISIHSNGEAIFTDKCTSASRLAASTSITTRPISNSEDAGAVSSAKKTSLSANTSQTYVHIETSSKHRKRSFSYPDRVPQGPWLSRTRGDSAPGKLARQDDPGLLGLDNSKYVTGAPGRLERETYNIDMSSSEHEGEGEEEESWTQPDENNREVRKYKLDGKGSGKRRHNGQERFHCPDNSGTLGSIPTAHYVNRTIYNPGFSHPNIYIQNSATVEPILQTSANLTNMGMRGEFGLHPHEYSHRFHAHQMQAGPMFRPPNIGISVAVHQPHMEAMVINHEHTGSVDTTSAGGVARAMHTNPFYQSSQHLIQTPALQIVGVPSGSSHVSVPGTGTLPSQAQKHDNTLHNRQPDLSAHHPLANLGATAARQPNGMFKCPWPGCDREFSARQPMIRHSYIHTDQRPHACHLCNARFRCASHLKRHTRLHLKERPYVCPECHKSFVDHTNMVRHRVQHHQARPYVCHFSGCKVGFTMERGLRTHMLQTHGFSASPANGLASRSTLQRLSVSRAATAASEEAAQGFLDRNRSCNDDDDSDDDVDDSNNNVDDDDDDDDVDEDDNDEDEVFTKKEDEEADEKMSGEDNGGKLQHRDALNPVHRDAAMDVEIDGDGDLERDKVDKASDSEQAGKIAGRDDLKKMTDGKNGEENRTKKITTKTPQPVEMGNKAALDAQVEGTRICRGRPRHKRSSETLTRGPALHGSAKSGNGPAEPQSSYRPRSHTIGAAIVTTSDLRAGDATVSRSNLRIDVAVNDGGGERTNQDISGGQCLPEGAPRLPTNASIISDRQRAASSSAALYPVSPRQKRSNRDELKHAMSSSSSVAASQKGTLASSTQPFASPSISHPASMNREGALSTSIPSSSAIVIPSPTFPSHARMRASSGASSTASHGLPPPPAPISISTSASSSAPPYWTMHPMMAASYLAAPPFNALGVAFNSSPNVQQYSMSYGTQGIPAQPLILRPADPPSTKHSGSNDAVASSSSSIAHQHSVQSMHPLAASYTATLGLSGRPPFFIQPPSSAALGTPYYSGFTLPFNAIMANGPNSSDQMMAISVPAPLAPNTSSLREEEVPPVSTISVATASVPQGCSATHGKSSQPAHEATARDGVMHSSQIASTRSGHSTEPGEEVPSIARVAPPQSTLGNARHGFPLVPVHPYAPSVPQSMYSISQRKQQQQQQQVQQESQAQTNVVSSQHYQHLAQPTTPLNGSPRPISPFHIPMLQPLHVPPALVQSPRMFSAPAGAVFHPGYGVVYPYPGLYGR